jgi:hypothetical protein
MTTHKPTIHLTDYNWADYFSDDYSASLVKGFKVEEGGIDRDDPIVTRLLAWVARETGRSKDARYEMTRHDAAVLLEQLAGYPDSLYVAEAFALPPTTQIPPTGLGRPKKKRKKG